MEAKGDIINSYNSEKIFNHHHQFQHDNYENNWIDGNSTTIQR